MIITSPAPITMSDRFHNFAVKTSQIVGSKWAFTVAVFSIILWAAVGPIFHYSDTWQLVINTATSVLTFLIVFLIQNSQNRDAKAIHLKLDEVIRAIGQAHNEMIQIETLSDKDLEDLTARFKRIRMDVAEGRIRARSGNLQDANRDCEEG
jgi:low affinity Fe/Cu permease